MPLHFQTLGHCDDAPLIFIHGLGAGARQTTSALTGLPRTRLIAPDMPGHGGSLGVDPVSFSFNTFADRIIELMDHLQIASTDLGGLSMGSGISINLALRYPERVKKLIILRPSWLHQARPKHLELVAQVGRWLAEDPAQAPAKLNQHPAYQKLSQHNPPAAASVRGLFDRPVVPSAVAVLFDLWQSAPFEHLQQLGAIKNRTLILDTPRDDLHPQHVAQKIAEHIPHARYGTLPPRYHDPAGYQQALNAQLQDFLQH